MCHILTEHFTGIFLFLCMVHHDPSDSGITVYATSSENPDEIKNIFSFPATETALKGSSENVNFGEGGLINTNLTLSTSRTSIKDLAKNSFIPENVSHNNNFIKNQNISPSNTKPEKGYHSAFEPSTVKSLLPTKLTETGPNLLLGVTEVIHINGTSSIKPRKGVHYNKIVPRKGVENENESSHDFLENEMCFQLTANECYNVTGMHGLQCSCCKESNMLGNIVKEQFLVNCKNCKPINILSSEKEICKSICCKSVVHDIYSASSSQNISDNYLKYETVTTTEKKKKDQNVFATKTSEKAESSNNFPKKMATEMKDALLNPKKNSKLKPSMTKVPYDVEVVTEFLSKTQQKVFVPIVSIFLLPLIGILLFFLWRRTKEYWEKRYYKRMDFLIDGIYND